jgi:hypothetical protein
MALQNAPTRIVGIPPYGGTECRTGRAPQGRGETGKRGNGEMESGKRCKAGSLAGEFAGFLMMEGFDRNRQVASGVSYGREGVFGNSAMSDGGRGC